MKNFTYKVAIFLCMISCILGSCLYFALRTLNVYKPENALYEKKLRILEQTKSPRIILIGGSNVLFGFDSHYMTKALGRNTVNMGMHAGIGLKFMIDRIKPLIKDGDIVIISPEYSHFLKQGSYYGELELLRTLDGKPSEFSYLKDYRQYLNLLRYVSDFIIDTKLLNNKQGKLDIKIDDLGDIYWDSISISNKPFAVESEIEPSYFNYKAINDVVDFSKHMKRMHGKLIFSFPYVPSSVYHDNISRTEHLNNYLINSGISVISRPSTSIASMHYFYDSIYHLNSVGRIFRTQNVVEELKLHLLP